MPTSRNCATEIINILKNFSDTLRKTRKSREISQQKLAEILGISRDYVSQMENGKEPSPRLRRDVEQWLGKDCLSSREDERSLSESIKTQRRHDMEPRVQEEPLAYGTGQEVEARMAALAEEAGIPASFLLDRLLAAAERELKEKGGLMFPLRLASQVDKQSTSAGENEG